MKRADVILQMLETNKKKENYERDKSPSIIENTPEREIDLTQMPKVDIILATNKKADDSLPVIKKISPEPETDKAQLIESPKHYDSQVEMKENTQLTEDEPKISAQRMDTRRSSSSSSSSSTSSSSSSSTSSVSRESRGSRPVPPRQTIRQNYQVSPINTGESDVDLSDTDPTYLDMNTRKRIFIPPSSSSSCSPVRPSNACTSNQNTENNDITDDNTPRQSRKRVRDPSNWKQNKIKRLRNSGKSYVSVSKSNKQIPARSLKDVCNCRLKCSLNILEADRNDLFDHYWKLADIELQRAYIRSCLLEVRPKYKYTNAERPRKPNNAFYFTVHGNKVRVCKKYFINTLDVTDRLLRTVVKKTNSMGFVEKDMRGRHANRKIIDPTLIQDIKDHINSIPRIESHYLRNQTQREFISDSKTITDIWKDFNETQRQKNRPQCEYWQYLNTFNTDFNIGFFIPKKDTCETCLAYELAPENRKLELKEKYEKHLIEKKLCREEKQRDRENVDTKHVCAVFDLQSVMLCPSPSYFYYSSKINCLDFTITELNNKNGENNAAYGDVFCYFWDETQGQRGANEIGSCVFDYLTQLSQKHPGEKLHVTFYSDNCTGQNKNKMMASLYSFAVANLDNIESITHKYLIKGHTQNEADNVHSLIEKEIRKNEKAGPIYTPYQYVTLIKSARKTGKPFTVKELDFSFFINVKDLQEKWGYNFNENSDKKTITWNDIKVLKFVKGNTFQFYCKTSYTETEYNTIDMRNKRKKMLYLEEIKPTKLYTEAISLKEKKKRDLKDLVRKNLIPSYYASFYNNL